MLVKFNLPIAGSTSRVDAMRIVDSTGNVGNDLDPRVLFSSNWPSMRVEEFSISVTGLTNQTVYRADTILLARTYGTWPVALGVFKTNSGQYIYPFFRTLTSRNIKENKLQPIVRTFLIFEISQHPSLAGRFYLKWTIDQSGEFPFSDGTLKIFVLGRR